MHDPDLMAMAQDELDRACSLNWRDLAKTVPWGDEFDGISPAGRNVTASRNYIWVGDPDGDILCEVRIYGGQTRYDHGAQASRLIKKP